MIYTEQNETVFEFKDVDRNMLYTMFLHNDHSYKDYHKTYYGDFMTMDIETTKDVKYDQPIAFTYSIATYIDGKCILCRTWEEYKQLVDLISDVFLLTHRNRLVCYVHNLPYEFQFMRDYFHVEEVFATGPRKVVKFFTKGIEYRCSYKLTNMGLDKFTKSIPACKHKKESCEDFDYTVYRTPRTALSPKELQYIYNDVAGLYECLSYTLEKDGHNTATVPLTSTGYVRRELRQAMGANPYNRQLFRRNRLNGYTYSLCRDARRGGNTHCNPMYSGKEWDDIYSMDMSSAYPAVMVQCKFPMSPFRRIRQMSDYEKYINSGKYAMLLDIEFIGLELKRNKQSQWCTIPYIPVAKCTFTEVDDHLVGDNGRLIKCSRCSMIITDIDYRIIKDTYNFIESETIVHDCLVSDYDYLPDELRDTIIKQYYNKTTLKDGDQYFYMKAKNKFNANFGCMLTDICQAEIIYTEHSMTPYSSDMKDLTNEEKIQYYTGKLDKYYNSKNSFLSYQHGLWVTAHCRNRLQKAINALGNEMLYCDTDSVKFFRTDENVALFEELNNEIKLETMLCGKNCTVHYNNKTYTLGLWENDGQYVKFKSFGAKKYCYIDHTDFIDGKEVEVDYEVFHITVAGLSKSKACKWLDEHGGMSAFRVGQIVPKEFSGRTTAIYNDYDGVRRLTIGDEEITLGSNMVIEDTTYQFTITKDYENLLGQLQAGVIL